MGTDHPMTAVYPTRIGFPLEAFHGPGDGTATEMEELLAAAKRSKFTVEKIWLTIKLYHSLVAAILAPMLGVESPRYEVNLTEGLRPGPIICAYRFEGKTLPFYTDPWLKEGCVVFEGEPAWKAVTGGA